MIIGIHGLAGSGKTTFAELFKYLALKSKFTDDCLIIPFAKPLKDFAKSLGWNSIKDKKGRRLLQLLGTECGRECIDEDIWVKHWINFAYLIECLPIETPILLYKKALKTQKIKNKNALIISDDVRFENEIECIKEMKGLLLKIKGRGYTDIDTSHKSEQIFDDSIFNYLIDNKGSILDLKYQAQGLINMLKEK